MSVIKVNNITNRDGTSGPVIAGITTVSSTSHMVVPTGRTGQRYVDDGENIVRSGLVLYLDAKHSYPSRTGIGTTTSGAAATPGSSLDGDPYTWYDMSGNGNDGTLVGSVAYNTTNGGSLVFDGVNDYVITPPMSLSGALTFSLWIKGNVRDGNDHVFIDTSPTNWGGDIGIMNFGNNLTVFGATGTTNALLDASSTIMTGNWINVVVTQTASTNATITSYLNGNFGTQVSLVNAISSSSNNVYIAGRSDATTFYGGNIAQVLIYNRALTAAEVLQNYNAIRSRFGL